MKETDKKSNRWPVKVPCWQIPPGLTPGNLDYVNSSTIAQDHDKFQSGNRLHDIDRVILDRYLPSQGDDHPQKSLVGDFGCGNGRTLMPLLKRGYRGLGVDLSAAMLAACRSQANADNLSQQLTLCQANLVQLEALVDNSLDAAVCMFSTLGMIRGRNNRAQFLQHVSRLLKPSSLFIVHAHNALFQLRQPGGWRLAAQMFARSITGKGEFGDRTSNYRGIPNMFIHSFRRPELNRDLQRSGFEVQRWLGIPTDENTDFDIDGSLPWFSDLRVVGWTVVARAV